MDTRVSELLKLKGTDVVTIERSTSVYAAIETMVNNKVGSVLVTHAGMLCGIFTERDYLRRIALEGRTSRSTMVGDVMTENLHYAAPDDTIEECMEAMTRFRTRHLPVLAAGELVGLVSIGDCVARLCREATVEVGYLREYICGTHPV